MSEENHEPIDEPQEERQPEPVIEWYIQVSEGKKAGPISFDRLKSFAEKGKIQPTTNVRNTAPDAAWLPARDVTGLYPEAEPTPEPAPEDEAPVEEPSEEVAVSDDSQAVKTPRIVIDAGPKKDEKKPEKPEEKKKAAFVIDTGASAKKKAEEPAPEKNVATVDDAPPEEKNPEEKKDESTAGDSTVISSPGIKISIGGADGKKEPKKDKKEKSSAGFKFKIDPVGSKKKEEPKEEPVAAEPAVAAPAPASTPKRREDKSSSDVRISIGAPIGKKKSDDSVAVAVKSKPKKEEENGDDSTDFEVKKQKAGGGALLMIVAVLSVILAFGGAIGLIVLGKETPGIAFSALLGGIVFLYGLMTGVVAWSLKEIVSTKNE